MADGWVQGAAVRTGFLASDASMRLLFPNPPSPVSTSNFRRGVSADGLVPYGTQGLIQLPSDLARGQTPYMPALDMIPVVPPLSPVIPDTTPKARDDYNRARRTPALAAVAELRLGDLDLLQDHPKSTLEHVAKALTRTSDPGLLSVARFIQGAADQRLGRWDDARTAYRGALDAAPASHAAALALADLLDQLGEPDEARALRAWPVDPGAVDPWKTFSEGDPMPFAGLIDQIRKAVR